MIKIKYNRIRTSVIINGHAGMSEAGNDIVCAAVSTLTYTLVRAIEGMVERDELNDMTVVKLESGDANISISPRFIFRKEARLVFDTICDGYEILAHDFPQYVELERI